MHQVLAENVHGTDMEGQANEKRSALPSQSNLHLKAMPNELLPPSLDDYPILPNA